MDQGGVRNRLEVGASQDLVNYAIVDELIISGRLLTADSSFADALLCPSCLVWRSRLVRSLSLRCLSVKVRCWAVRS